MAKKTNATLERLDAKIAHKMCGRVLEVLEYLNLSGTFMVCDNGGNPLAAISHGEPRPCTFFVALSKNKQVAHTGACSDETAKSLSYVGEISKERSLSLYGLKKEGLAPFAGGCPIISPSGKRLGTAAFSEETEWTDKYIVVNLIEEHGYSSKYPAKQDIDKAVIKAAFEATRDT